VDDDDGVIEVQRHDLKLDAPVVLADPDQASAAVAVAATRWGATESMTNIAWALPIRWRRAERNHRSVRSTG
jgi:glucokinase